MSAPGRSSQRCRGVVKFGALLLLAAGPSAALANAECTITAVSLNFGTYDNAVSTPDDTAGTVTVTCNYVAPGATNVSYVVTLSNGLYGASATTRQMGSGSDRLGYNVFLDSGRSQVWGTGTGGTVVASGSMTVGPGVGNGTRTTTHTLYGRVPALQDAEPGTYLDSLALTLNY